MKWEDYPFMKNFMAGAFGANSGGWVDERTEFLGTAEEFAKAEEELEQYSYDMNMAGWLGMQADSGYTTTQQDENGGPDSKLLCYEILERYY